ncbi:hypothetical protein AKJ09_04273 [Labilithrix luteola]|uniref:Cyclase/dehydrase n=1 Tax=Labilithrix luteola TaxID=1391654 RepID=A0A0K1PWU6_9BACT|nr:SRPBCC family protein [Labilithrix luteola]AKU97609.1 hypothetical protein AKJ09_04273 [Labilithrix luteola]
MDASTTAKTASPAASTVAPPASPASVDESPSGAWPFGPPLSPDEKAAQIERLTKDPGPLKSNWVPPGKSDRYGHAEAWIGAPYDVVRARLEDFPHYKELAGPKFKKVSVVDKQPTGTDLYFQLPIMKGIVTLWYVTRFPAPRPLDGGEVIEGNFVKGNIKGMHIAFNVRPGADAKSTVVTCDLLLSLNIPAPQSNVDEELRDACGDALNALRARSTQ